jgi:hypothetical protein
MHQEVCESVEERLRWGPGVWEGGGWGVGGGRVPHTHCDATHAPPAHHTPCAHRTTHCAVRWRMRGAGSRGRRRERPGRICRPRVTLGRRTRRRGRPAGCQPRERGRRPGRPLALSLGAAGLEHRPSSVRALMRGPCPLSMASHRELGVAQRLCGLWISCGILWFSCAERQHINARSLFTYSVAVCCVRLHLLGLSGVCIISLMPHDPNVCYVHARAGSGCPLHPRALHPRLQGRVGPVAPLQASCPLEGGGGGGRFRGFG